MIIQDSSTGYTASVSETNKLQTTAVSIPVMTEVSRQIGQSFVFASGDFINITTTNTEYGFLFIRNDSTTKDLHIQSIRTCGTQLQKWKLYANITGGTLLTGETAGSDNNLNLGSSNASDVTVYKGANGVTHSGGTMLEHWITDIGHSREDFEGALVLSPSDNIVVSIETPVAGDFCSRIIGYRGS